MRRAILTWAVAVCLLPAFHAEGLASSHELRVLSRTENGFRLEFVLGPLEFQTEEQDGRVFQRVVTEDLGLTREAGLPEVPVRGFAMAVPGPDPEGVSITVLETEVETLTGVRLRPAPGRVAVEDERGALRVEERFEMNEDVYAADAFHPGPLVRKDGYARIRHQDVLQVSLFPVQANPVRSELLVYRRVLLEVRFDSPGMATKRMETGAAQRAFDPILRSVLVNYDPVEAARAPGATDGPQARPATAGVRTGAVTWWEQIQGLPGDRLKIGVDEDGVYVLTHAALTGAGLDLSALDPRNLRLFNQGEEVPILIVGEEDGVFDPADQILFYGQAMTGRFTDRNVYWLLEGDGPGLRMAERDGTPTGGPPVPERFFTTLHAEVDRRYFGQHPGDMDADRWFWEKLDAPASFTATIRLDNISPEPGAAALRVLLMGRTATSTYPDHHTRIYLNGVLKDDAWWDGQVEYLHEIALDQTELLEGNNTVTVQAVGDTGSPVDSVYLNWIQVDHFDTYTAEGDRLRFEGDDPGTYRFQVAPFSQAWVDVLDISDPRAPVAITGFEMEPEGGQYRLFFDDTLVGETTYVALTPARRMTPTSILLDEPSDLFSPANAADYLVITHEEFHDAVLPLAAYRQAQGLRTKVVKITDVYDEFHHGIFHPQAIRDFIRHAYENWSPPALTYVLLVGDANQDHKDRLGSGLKDYVPVHLFYTRELGETISDNWYACVSGDDVLPDVLIGRLCVRNQAEAAGMVAKILSYEQAPPDGDWSERALFVAGSGDSAFEGINEGLAADYLPETFTARRVYRSAFGSGDAARLALLDELDQGALLVNYIGHGNVHVWAELFSSGDVSLLTNANRTPFVVTMTCLNGLFGHPQDPYSLAETFMRFSDKGAIGCWSPTTVGYTSEHRVLNRELYGAIFHDRNLVVGSAVTTAKILGYTGYGLTRDIIETMTLFGDPALTLALPGGNGGCFIATAAYGSATQNKIDVLRNCRDRHLLNRPWGRLLVAAYERYSPPVAGVLAERPGLRAVVRWFLAPVIGAAWLLG